MEYDLQTGRCTTIGQSYGEDSGEAKEHFMRERDYEPRKHIWLVARGPFYR